LVVILAGQLSCVTSALPRYEVRGRLLDPRRQPILSAVISTPEIGDTVVADSGGRFVLTGTTPPQCYRVILDAPGFALTQQAISLWRGGVVDLGDLVLERNVGTARGSRSVFGGCDPPAGLGEFDWAIAWAAVQGRVADANGIPRAQERVATDCPGGDSTRADDAGFYRLDLRLRYSQRQLLSHGRRSRCRVWLPGLPGDTVTLHVRFRPSPVPDRPAVASFGRDRLYAPYAVQIAGTVLDAQSGTSIQGARIEVPEFSAVTSAASDGAFALRFRAPKGCFRLIVRYIGYLPIVRRLAVASSEARDVGRLLLVEAAFDMEPLPAPSGPDDCVPTVPIPASTRVLGYGEVAGRILWSDGRPYRSAPLSLLCPGFPSTYADADGYFRLDLRTEDWGIDSLRGARSMQCNLEDRTVPTQLFPVSVPLAPSPLRVRPIVHDVVRAVPPPRPPAPAGPSIARAVCVRPGRRTVTIVGAVRDSTSDLPLAGVNLFVRALSPASPPQRPAAVRSDSLGAFTLDLRGPGCHMLFVDARYRLAGTALEDSPDTARVLLRVVPRPLPPGH
jgi:hypothetical protein